jgi:hypothetical protein
MAAPLTCKPQQARFLNRILRRKDSVIASPTRSVASSITPSITSLSQDNDNLAELNSRLHKRNQELIQQCEINQSLFQGTSEALMAKEKEMTELKQCMRRNGEGTKEAIQTLRLQIESLGEQFAGSEDMTIEREASLSEQLSQVQNMAAEREVELTERRAEAQHIAASYEGELDDPAKLKLAEQAKTIVFLRCRQAKSDKRIQKLKKRCTAAEEDWEKTIKMANAKVKAKAAQAAQAEADAQV